MGGAFARLDPAGRGGVAGGGGLLQAQAEEVFAGEVAPGPRAQRVRAYLAALTSA